MEARVGIFKLIDKSKFITKIFKNLLTISVGRGDNLFRDIILKVFMKGEFL